MLSKIIAGKIMNINLQIIRKLSSAQIPKPDPRMSETIRDFVDPH